MCPAAAGGAGTRVSRAAAPAHAPAGSARPRGQQEAAAPPRTADAPPSSAPPPAPPFGFLRKSAAENSQKVPDVKSRA